MKHKPIIIEDYKPNVWAVWDRKSKWIGWIKFTEKGFEARPAGNWKIQTFDTMQKAERYFMAMVNKQK